MNKNLLKTLIIFLTVSITNTVTTFADEVEQTIYLSVSPTVNITKKASSVETASVNAGTGVHSGLRLAYDIYTNGDDNDYDFTITSYITSQDGTVSAYGNNGCLLFAHETNPPTTQAVTNAKNGILGNANVIAYPVTATIESPMTVNYHAGYGTYGDCYVVLVNNTTASKELTYSVGTTPVANTYELATDQSGSYKTNVTLTVTPKN